jgi:hypothetical protein
VPTPATLGGVPWLELCTSTSTRVCQRALHGTLVFCGGLALFVGIGAIRLWSRISDPLLPLSLIWPFARPLLAVALELAFLLSVPIALGWSVSTRAARALGVASWRELALSTCVLVTALGALSFGLSSWLDDAHTAPGRMAAELLSSARETCTERTPPATVRVPLLGFEWMCTANALPRLRGQAPLGKQAEFEAMAIDLADDLRRIAWAHLKLSFRTPAFAVQVRAERATLRGLPPWGRSRRIPLALRACLFVVSVALATYGVGSVVTRAVWLPSWAGALLGAALAGALWFAFSWLERQEPVVAAYFALPLTAVCGWAAAAVCLPWCRLRWLRAHREKH